MKLCQHLFSTIDGQLYIYESLLLDNPQLISAYKFHLFLNIYLGVVTTSAAVHQR